MLSCVNDCIDIKDVKEKIVRLQEYERRYVLSQLCDSIYHLIIVIIIIVIIIIIIVIIIIIIIIIIATTMKSILITIKYSISLQFRNTTLRGW